MNEELDLEESLDYKEILEAYKRVPDNKKSDFKDFIIRAADLLEEKKYEELF